MAKTAKKTPKKTSKKPVKAEKKEKSAKKVKVAKELKKPVKTSDKSAKNVKSKTKEEVEAPAVHTQSRTDKSKLPSILQSKAFAELNHQLDLEEKKLNIQRTDLFVGGHVADAISTGLLSLDFNMGGGYQPGRLTVHPGPEKAGKTTGIVTSMANAVAQNVPVTLCDTENAFDASYADRAMARFGYSMKKMMGVYDKKKEIWLEQPMVRINQEQNGEAVFNYLQRMMARMPIIKRDHDNHYWAVWQTLNKDGSVKKEVVEENDGTPQRLIYIDSLASMIPDILDSDDEKETLGALARMFTVKLPKTCKLLRKHNCILVGSNQLRDKIGGFSRPGMPPPQSMPGGNALRFYTSTRTFFKPCAPSTAGWVKSDSEFTEEPSIYGGIDRYQFTMFKNNKHKSFMPNRVSFARIRSMHDGGGGDGYDEAFDIFTFLQASGQASKRGTTLSLDIQPAKKSLKMPNLPLDPQSKKMGWTDFKRAVEDPANKHRLFDHCRAQIKSGYAFDLERERVTNTKVAYDESDDG